MLRSDFERLTTMLVRLTHLLRRLSIRAPLPLLPFVAIASLWRYMRRNLTVVKSMLFGIQIGRHPHIGHGLRFVYPKNVTIGSHCVLGSSVRLWSEDPKGILLVGDNVEIGRDCVLDFSGDLTVGDNALISEGSILYTHDHGYDPRSQPSCSSLYIGSGAWIGSRAIVLPSVSRIGNNSVIGAGAVVTKDVPDDCVYVSASGRILSKAKTTAR